MATTTYTYFVSFSHTGGFGNLTLDTPAPITHNEQLRDIARQVARQCDLPEDQVVILNYQLLRQQHA
jgi:hypothetical protein